MKPIFDKNELIFVCIGAESPRGQNCYSECILKIENKNGICENPIACVT